MLSNHGMFSFRFSQLAPILHVLLMPTTSKLEWLLREKVTKQMPENQVGQLL